MLSRPWALLFVFATFVPAHADAAFLLEEPYGTFGALNPTGHAAVYLTRICAASFSRLRRCEPGEAGVVISRYHKIGGYDWVAILLLPYLYAVDTLQEIPQSADARSVAALRDTYRRAHLLAIAPSDANGRAPKGEWIQLIGSSYDRTIYGFRFETSQEQDDAFIQQLNDRKNKSHFNLCSANCADFARTIRTSTTHTLSIATSSPMQVLPRRSKLPGRSSPILDIIPIGSFIPFGFRRCRAVSIEASPWMG